MANFEVLALNNSKTQETQWTRKADSGQEGEPRAVSRDGQMRNGDCGMRNDEERELKAVS